MAESIAQRRTAYRKKVQDRLLSCDVIHGVQLEQSSIGFRLLLKLKMKVHISLFFYYDGRVSVEYLETTDDNKETTAGQLLAMKYSLGKLCDEGFLL